MGKIALVTGATSGIGASFTRFLAAKGYDLVLVARDEKRLGDCAEELLEKYGVTSEIISADLSTTEGMRLVEDRIKKFLDPIEVLINNAGFGIRESFLESNIDEEENLINLLAKAPMRLMHAALPIMKSRNIGVIINVSSVAGWLTSGTYSAAKSYLTVLSESLHTELRATQVKVLALAPGFTRTEFHQRSGMKMKGLPPFLWLDADEIVEKAWDDALKGEALSIPGWQYGLLSTIARFGPRPVVRRLGIKIRARQRRK